MDNCYSSHNRSLDELLEKSRRLQRETQKILTQLNGARVDFLMRELEIGLTFAGFAQHSDLKGAPGLRHRQKFAAQEAYREIVRFRHLTKLTKTQEIRIENGVAELGAILKRLP